MLGPDAEGLGGGLARVVEAEDRRPLHLVVDREQSIEIEIAAADAGDGAMNLYVMQEIEHILATAAKGVARVKVDNINLIDNGDGTATFSAAILNSDDTAAKLTSTCSKCWRAPST